MPKERTARQRTEFGARMLKARKDSGLTQQQVEQKLGVSQSTLSELEGPAHGSTRVAEFAALYGVSPIWLSTGAGPQAAVVWFNQQTGAARTPQELVDAEHPKKGGAVDVRQPREFGPAEAAALYGKLSHTGRWRFLLSLAAAMDDPPEPGEHMEQYLWNTLTETKKKDRQPTTVGPSAKKSAVRGKRDRTAGKKLGDA
jgi:transcriptional regulator with XRE-family HTH domain